MDKNTPPLTLFPFPSSFLPRYEREKEEVAQSLLASGQLALIQGELQVGLSYFEEALKLEPNNGHFYYAQALSLFEYSEKNAAKRILLLAHKKFKKAASLNPDHFDCWHAWGSALKKMGFLYQQPYFFQQAWQTLAHAVTLGEKQPPDVLADLYWELGAVCSHLAQTSGEALDYHRALQAFQHASLLHKQTFADFWKEYGLVCYHLGQKVNDSRFFTKAISCLKNALSLSPSSVDLLHLLASVFQALYLRTHDEDHFAQANECYQAATHLQPHASYLWLSWAQFLCESSRLIYDSKRLHACIEKCQRAYSHDPSHPLIAALWAESLAIIGSQEERLDLIYEGHNKLFSFLENAETLPVICYAHAITLKALGQYFNDCDYYYQAIEKFQEGLSIDRTCHPHWHAIGQLYCLLGELENDPVAFKRSIRFYHKAINLHPCTFYLIDYATALLKLGEAIQDRSSLEKAVLQFERAFTLQKNAPYLHANWLFSYGCALDSLGGFYEEEHYYLRAIDLFSQALMIQPDLYQAHHRLALALSHLGDLTGDRDLFHRAVHHLRLSAKHLEDNDSIILDWAITLISAAYHHADPFEADQLYKDAEYRLWKAVQMGNPAAYYHLACLYSLLCQYEKAMHCLHRGAYFDILPSVEEMLDDEWLDHLRMAPSFNEFIAQLELRDPHRE